jgi:uncharacterized protein YbjT (DUF2867 family)
VPAGSALLLSAVGSLRPLEPPSEVQPQASSTPRATAASCGSGDLRMAASSHPVADSRREAAGRVGRVARATQGCKTEHQKHAHTHGGRMDVHSIALTGSTGFVGGLVAKHLDAASRPHRLLARDPSSSSLPALASTTGVGRVDYADHDVCVASLLGCDVLLMVSAHESHTRARDHATFVNAAVGAGVRHVVYTSFIGAAANATFTLARDHFATEEHIRASGMAWTFLRDSFYLDFVEKLVGSDGVIRGPAGDGQCAFVARVDVARVAATVLQDPAAHSGQTYNLTGPEALSLSRAADVLRAVRGMQVTFHDESVDEAYASRASYGAPQWLVDAWVSTYTAIASGVMAEVTPAVEEITGTPPLSLEAHLRAVG